MLDTQRPDGGWFALVDDPASGDETSTAAFMAVGFLRAAHLGIGDPSRLEAAAARAWVATCRSVDDTGLLTGVSAAVYSSTRPSHYRHVSRGFDVPWGQGPLLVAALERERGRT
jgi:unsaturated rhamnogalacturonyl hydrolase